MEAQSVRVRRCGAVDFLKAFAIVGVLLIHASTDGYENPIGSVNWFSSLFWGSVSRASVPIFFMVSGALMLDPERELSLKKLWTRNLPRLLAALLFWSLAYQLCNLIFSAEGVTAAGLAQALKATVTFRYEFHLYFLHIMLLVYALLPATRLITAHADRRTLEYLLAGWASLAVLYPTFQGLWPVSSFANVFDRYALNSTYACVGYGLLGWYLRKYAVSRRKWAVTALVGFVMVYGGVTIATWRTGELALGALQGTSPGVVLLGAGICGWAFAFFRDTPPRAALLLSKASFCVFLVHVFFLHALESLGLHANAGPCVLFVPLTAAAVLACSLAVWFLLSRVPIIKDWLI